MRTQTKSEKGQRIVSRFPDVLVFLFLFVFVHIVIIAVYDRRPCESCKRRLRGSQYWGESGRVRVRLCVSLRDISFYCEKREEIASPESHSQCCSHGAPGFSRMKRHQPLHLPAGIITRWCQHIASSKTSRRSVPKATAVQKVWIRVLTWWNQAAAFIDDLWSFYYYYYY